MLNAGKKINQKYAEAFVMLNSQKNDKTAMEK